MSTKTPPVDRADRFVPGTCKKPAGPPKRCWLGVPRLGDPDWPAYVKKWRKDHLAKLGHSHVMQS